MVDPWGRPDVGIISDDLVQNMIVFGVVYGTLLQMSLNVSHMYVFVKNKKIYFISFFLKVFIIVQINQNQKWNII